MAKNTGKSEITIENPNASTIIRKVYIEGDSDLILNKMDNVTARAMAGEQGDEPIDLTRPNKWEKIITSIHWYNGDPTIFTEESFEDKLKNDKPCITGFGLKKSFLNAVTRNEISTYGTKLDATLNVMDTLVPVDFVGHYIEEKLMSPKKGHPVLARLNHFQNWKACFHIKFLENVYTATQILNIINLAGFGCGIGSGRPSGYGRFHVVNVE